MGFLQASERSFQTRSGEYEIYIPVLKLPEFSRVSLVEVGTVSFPLLPEWKNSRFIPEEPSWLDESGKLYKEGINAYYKGRNEIALEHFRQIEESHPDRPWSIPSMFWSGQLLALQGRYRAATEKLKSFESESEGVRFPLRGDFLHRSHYVRIWLELKKNREDPQTLTLLKRELERVTDSRIRFMLFELQLVVLESLGKLEETVQLLYGLQEDYPENLKILIWLAEFHHRHQNWQPLSKLVGEGLNGNRPLPALVREKLLLMGIHAEIQLGRLDRANIWVEKLRDVTAGSPDLPALARIRVHQLQKDYSRIKETWSGMEDPTLRILTLREIHRVALEDRQYGFLAGFEFDKIFWRGWEAEGQIIRAQAMRLLDRRKDAYRVYQLAYIKAENQPPIRETALFQRTLIELELRDLDKARAHLQQLLETYPESIRKDEYFFWYALVLHEKHDNPTASLMALRQIQNRGERADDSLYLQGRIHLEQSNWKLALRSLTRLRSDHPGSPYLEDGLRYLAEAFYHQKKHVEAHSVLAELRRRFHQLKKPSVVIHLQARNMMAMGDHAGASQILQTELRRHSDFSLIQLQLEVLEKLKDQEGILEVTQLGLNLSVTENQSYLHFHRANALFKTKRLLKAFVHYEQALLNPPAGQDSFIRYRLIKIHYLLGEYADFESGAESYVDEIKEGDYSNELLQLLGNRYAAVQRLEKALFYRDRLVKNLEKTVRNPELKPLRRLELVSRIGELYNIMESHQAAEQWLNRALKLMEDVPGGKERYHLKILREKGLAAFKQGKPKRALSADLKVKYLDKKLPHEQKYDLNLRIAASYLMLKRNREAKAIYRTMLKEFKEEEFQGEIKRRMKQLEQQEK
ncbi:MAG: tetratricopeptide repeat protein [SAR324 cluster bacterium]|nr:tetratricopeptide repeat protein [SAR324 cluster bacterium]